MKPIVLTWPYGAYNEIGVQEARQLGFEVCLTLDTGFADVKRLDRVNRYYVNLCLELGAGIQRKAGSQTAGQNSRFGACK